ncbi:MAG: hypothetical protein JW928_00730 [Candidatus Aureabacteria bacterium]|nr:hypothetical protein [Candidatus Auribacterota bacterium]
MKQNRRKLLINSRTKSIFALFVVFSFIVAFVFLGWEIIIQFVYFNHYELYESLFGFSNLGLLLKSILLVFWVGFTFFSAYFYMESKYSGIFARMDRLFTDISQGQDKRLFFRESDSFAYIAESFNRMVANLKTGGDISQQDKIQEVVKKLENLLQRDDVPKQEIETILKTIKEFL